MTTQTPQLYSIYSKPFQEIREECYLYIDKTNLIYKMTHPIKKYVFLSRPRRFGKSLLVTTLKAYFEGKKDLFKGLAIEKLEKEWQEYPVLHFDLSTVKDIESRDDLLSKLNSKLLEYESIYGSDEAETMPSLRLEGIIERAYEKTGKRVVVLIDEYDAPILDAFNKDILEAVREIMSNFYCVLKSSGSYLKFVFLTGIIKFSLSDQILGGLNVLDNISMDKKFASICGITEDEMLSQLKLGIENLAKENGLTYDVAVERLKSEYNGYHFTKGSPDIYNPYSLLNALSDRKINSYWFETGNPTFLIETLKRFDTSLINICNKFFSEYKFYAPVETMKFPAPLLYQAGYITIKDYDIQNNKYLLDFPNKEVREGLLNFLLKEYITPICNENYVDIAKEIAGLIKGGKMEDALLRIKQFFKTVSFTTQKQNKVHYLQEIGMLLSLGGLSIRAMEWTLNGQIDIRIFLKDVIYVVELMLGKSAREAIKQIDENEYAKTTAFKYPQSKVIKVGINFDDKTCTISDYIIEPLEEE